MNRISLEVPLGLLAGMASWFVVPLVSDRFEPYDSGIGLGLGQAAMVSAAYALGFLRGMKAVWVFLASAYLGLNLYPMLFGSSESRAWAGLGLLMSLLLCIAPLLTGLLGKVSRLVRDALRRRKEEELA
jgi:hypothetical protein